MAGRASDLQEVLRSAQRGVPRAPSSEQRQSEKVGVEKLADMWLKRVRERLPSRRRGKRQP
jgi:hypothetical protein